MAVISLTVVPLVLLHLVLWRWAQKALGFQLLFDLCLVAVFGAALIRGLDLYPVRCVQRAAPFTAWSWSEYTELQPTQSDVVLQLHPWWAETRRQLLAGEAPWISERIGGGLPVFANGQSGLLAPVMAPVWLLGPERGTTVMAFWRLELAGLGTFFLLWRCWRLRFSAAAVGALAYGFGCYQVAWLLSPLATATAALPWVWWGTQHVLRRRSRWPSLVLVGLLVGWFLGGGINPSTATVVVGSSWLAGLILHPRRWLRLAVLAVVVTVGMLLLSWPTISYIAASGKTRYLHEVKPNRQTLPSEVRTAAVQQLLVPAVHGHPGRGDWRQLFPYAAPATGVGGVALALIAAGRMRRRHGALICAALASVAVAAILAYRVPPLDWVLVRFPPFDLLTLPRFAVLASWGLALLAALATDGLARGRCRGPAWRWSVPLLLSAVVAWAGLGGLSPGSLTAVGVTLAVAAATAAAGRWRVWLVPLMIVELMLLAVGVNPTAHPTDRLPEPPALEHLQQLVQQHPGRVMGLGRALPPNLASRYGLADLRAFDPTRPHPFTQMMGYMGEAAPILGGPLATAPERFCGAWSVRFLMAGPHDGPGEGWQLVWQDPSASIWRNRYWLSEVRLAGRVVEAAGEEAWQLIAADQIDFAVTAVVPSDSPPVAAENAQLLSLDATPTGIEAGVSCDGPCLLVVARPWAPGWRAEVDGREAELVRTNLAGMGVVAPAGHHEVQLSYHPWHW